MKSLLEVLSDEVGAAFEKAGYRREAGNVTLSNRPDLCEFQCNGALSLAKEAHKAPIAIAEEVAGFLIENPCFSEAAAVKPGFLNLKLSGEYLVGLLNSMKAPDFGYENSGEKQCIILDYGGPNVAKPLHIGHLRSAIIGDSIRRILSFAGHRVIGDIHLGDWGLQMGLIITELKKRKGGLPYFDESFDGEYPKEPPFTLSELEEIYPTASLKAKEDEAYKKEAMEATLDLQHGRKGYYVLWRHIMNVSTEDLKRNYRNLNVEFDLWKGESDADAYIPKLVEKLKESGQAYESQGALVVDVSEEDDKKEIPPCMILKSDGAALYTTTDLGTLMQREEEYHPDRIIYVVDKRQALHFEQVFRCAKKTGIVPESMRLDFLGFGTMNGPDGQPFKTREGGVMRLEALISDVNANMLEKMCVDGVELSEKEVRETATIVALSAIKYGDLSNQASKDYVFDIEKFTSFEGNTGPYILYTIVRIKSILRKHAEAGGSLEKIKILPPESGQEKALMLKLTQFSATVHTAAAELAPHKICAFMYEIANEFNRFYHETKILSEENNERKQSLIGLITLTREILSTCLGLLGMEAAEKM
ncbi:MAG: arginine--tRNA ligase [Lachnospiraceae bacterium]|nr:arginine--tRNA ligase [Lachnospiraceae bacterium]